MISNSGTNIVSDLDGHAPQGRSELFTLTGVKSEAPARLKLDKMNTEMRKSSDEKKRNT